VAVVVAPVGQLAMHWVDDVALPLIVVPLGQAP
jgi:hypothetical protein